MINVKSVALCVAIEQGDASGPPLLLINGIGANLELFDPLIEALDNVGECEAASLSRRASLCPHRERDAASLVYTFLRDESTSGNKG